MTELKPVVTDVQADDTKPTTSDLNAAVSNVPLPLNCRLGLHRWSVWSAPIVERIFQQRMLSHERRYQLQFCIRCNRRRERPVAYKG